MRRRWGAFALVAALALAACGGGSDDDAADSLQTDPTSTVDEQPTETDDGVSDDPVDRAPQTTTTAGDAVDDDDEAADEPPEGLCVLLTKAEAEELLDVSLEPRRQSDEECEWETSDEARAISIERSDVGGYDYDSVEQWRDLQQGPATDPVEGVGDEAYFGVLDSELSVLIGDEVYNIQVRLDEGSSDYDPASDKTAERELAQQVARTAADRLG